MAGRRDSCRAGLRNGGFPWPYLIENKGYAGGGIPELKRGQKGGGRL